MPRYDMDELSRFMKAFDKASILYLLPVLALPFVLDFVFSLQPPWPQSSTYVTAVLQLSLVFMGFNVKLRKRKALLRWQTGLGLMMVLCFLCFFVGYAFFVTATPLTGELVIKGFVCTADAQSLQSYFGPCPFLPREALAAAEYETERLWQVWSIRVVEVGLFAVWSIFFMASAFFMALSVSFWLRQKAMDPADKPD